jgi:hypothetical protein
MLNYVVAFVNQNPYQPRFEIFWLAQRGQIFVTGEYRFLYSVSRVLVVSQVAFRHAVHILLVRCDKLRKRVRVAGFRP